MRTRLLFLTLGLIGSAATVALAQTWGRDSEAPPIDIAKAPAPLFDDPVWHAPTDPDVLWNPIKKEWAMYYTQRRGTMENSTGVEWVHGTAIGIATSPDALHWKYQGVCQGDQGLGDPLKEKVTWWAPGLVWDGDTLHMFVTWVDGIYTKWDGKRFIKHFTSTDGVNFKYVSTAKLSSERCIDPFVYKVGDTWHMVYKDEAAGSHIFTVSSKNLDDWSDPTDIIHDVSQEGPWVIRWKDAWWMISDPLRQPGLRVYKSENGVDGWVFNNAILQQPGHRPDDQRPGAHPAVIVQGDKAIIFYFVDGGRRTVIQMAELELGADGKVTCDRDKYAAATTEPATQR